MIQLNTSLADNVGGGGLYCRSSSEVRLEGIELSENFATGEGTISGGGAFFEDCEAQIDSLVAVDNSVLGIARSEVF